MKAVRICELWTAPESVIRRILSDMARGRLELSSTLEFLLVSRKLKGILIGLGVIVQFRIATYVASRLNEDRIGLTS